MKPLVRVMLDNGLSYQEFDELTKQTFVEVADKEFQPEKKKQSSARVAMLTGINRKEIQNIKDAAASPSDENAHKKLNRASAVVSAWHREIEYKGKALPKEGSLSVTSLVKKFSGDIPVGVTLDELMRVGSVIKNNEGLYELVNPTYIPRFSRADKFVAVAEAARDLISTGHFNMQQPNDDEDRMQLTVSYNQLRREAVDQFKRMSDQKNLELILEFDKWLAFHEVLEPEKNEEPLFRTGVGMYFLEESANEIEKESENKSLEDVVDKNE